MQISVDRSRAAVFDARRAFPPSPIGIVVTLMDSCLSAHSIVIAAPEQISCLLGGELAALNLKNAVYYGLNPVGTRI